MSKQRKKALEFFTFIKFNTENDTLLITVKKNNNSKFILKYYCLHPNSISDVHNYFFKLFTLCMFICFYDGIYVKAVQMQKIRLISV